MFHVGGKRGETAFESLVLPTLVNGFPELDTTLGIVSEV